MRRLLLDMLRRGRRRRRRDPNAAWPPLRGGRHDPGYSFSVGPGLQGLVVECSTRRGVLLSYVPPSLELMCACEGDQVTHVNGVNLVPMTRRQAIHHLRVTRDHERVFRCRPSPEHVRYCEHRVPVDA